MPKQVSYGRGNAGYVLTLEERAALTGLRDTLQVLTNNDISKDDIGLGVPIYTYLRSLLTDQVEAPFGVIGSRTPTSLIVRESTIKPYQAIELLLAQQNFQLTWICSAQA